MNELSFYVGPYIECLNDLEPGVEKYRGCGNTSCSQFNIRINREEIKYCQSCGKPILMIEKEISKKRICSFMITEDIDEVLMSVNRKTSHDNIDFYIPNVPFGIKRDCWFGRNSDGRIIEIDELTIKKENEGFLQFFKDAIFHIKKAYGNGKIKWGVILEWG